MRKLSLTVITCVLLLAMLAVPIFGGTLNASAADTTQTTTPANPAFTEVDEYRFITPNYRSAWKGSTITNKYSVFSPASDGQYNGAMQWTAAGSASLDSDGVLSFPADGTNYYLSFRPHQNSAHNISAGPIRIAIEIYHDATTPKVSYEGSGGWFFHINGDGKLYYNSNRYWEPSKTNTGYTLTEGWNTIEMLFVPVCADGTISTVSTDTIAENHLYLRAYPSSTETNANLYTSEELATNFYHASLGTNDRKHFANGICNGFIVITDKDSGDDVTDTLKIRSAAAANLEPYVILPTASFLGYDGLNQVITPGVAITLPSAENVVAWLTEDNACYLPGDEYTPEASVSFMPVLSNMFRIVNGYDSAVQWATGKPSATSWNTNYHSGDGHSPVLQWYGTENITDGSARGWTYDETDKSFTIYKSDWNDITLYPKKATVSGVSFTGANCVMTSFDFKYTAGGGATISAAGKKISISNAGVVTVAGTEAGILQEGWNNFRIYYIPSAFEADGTTPTTYRIYVGVNQTAPGATVSLLDLLDFPHYDWTNGALPGGDKLSVVFSASTGSIPIGLRNIKNNRLDATPASNVYIEELGQMYLVPTGDSLTLPTSDNIAYWYDGVNLYETGAQYTPTTALTQMLAVTVADAAYQVLEEATQNLAEANSIVKLITALDELTLAMNNALLDTEDARYIAASEAKETAVTELNTLITDSLATIDETNGSSRYNLLIGAISVHHRAKAYMLPATATALEDAITAYNAFVDAVNGDVVEATTVAIAVTVEIKPGTEIVAILADIKSKVEDAE